MPTPDTKMRLGAELLDAARDALHLPPGTPPSQIVRAALRVIAGESPRAGISDSRPGPKPKTRRGDDRVPVRT
jgi:hypothetical protein